MRYALGNGEPNNKDRAGWALAAVAAFIKACPTDAEDAPGDLIVDILHLMRSLHPDFDAKHFLLGKLQVFNEEEKEERDA